MGANTSVSTYDKNLILTSWLDGHIKIMRPENGEILESLENLNVPVSATKFNDQIAIAMHGDQSIILHNFKTGTNSTLADGFIAPTHVVNYADKLLVSDRGAGALISIDAEGNKEILIKGLDSPEGIAIKDDSVFVFEGNTGEIKKIKDNIISTVANVNPGSNVQSEFQPPSMVFNGLAIKGDYLYISGESERTLFRIKI